MGEITEEEFDDYLDRTYGDINVCGFTHSASEVWKAVDPDGYAYAMTTHEREEDD